MTSTYPLNFFNTLSRQKEIFTPKNAPRVTLYTCGPTVYHYAHIGNLRTYVFEDILKRTLQIFGYEVEHVMNITDVDDKTIREAKKKGSSLREYTEVYTKAFLEDVEKLSIIKAKHYPKATDYISEMIEMIQTLLNKKAAYIGEDGSVYFSIRAFSKYGELSQLKLQELQDNASGRLSDEYDKDVATDFVLWKAYDKERDGDFFWESPFGKGRPGWHIECSAMAVAILGTDIDLHCGGVDNIFPHHENEIAQSECACGKTFARFWMHSEHLLVQNKKMAKSAGNFFTLRDLEGKGFSPREVRFMLMQGHYRTQLNFTMEGLEGARASLQRLDDFVYRLRHTTFDGGMHNEHIAVFDQAMKSFMQALADDLNVAEALSVVFTLIRQVNSLLDESKISQGDAEYLLDLLGKFDQVLALFQVEKEEISEEIEKLLALREKARKEKKWSESDAYRDQIEAKGFILEDSPQGPRLKRKKG